MNRLTFQQFHSKGDVNSNTVASEMIHYYSWILSFPRFTIRRLRDIGGTLLTFNQHVLSIFDRGNLETSVKEFVFGLLRWWNNLVKDDYLDHLTSFLGSCSRGGGRKGGNGGWTDDLAQLSVIHIIFFRAGCRQSYSIANFGWSIRRRGSWIISYIRQRADTSGTHYSRGWADQGTSSAGKRQSINTNVSTPLCPELSTQGAVHRERVIHAAAVHMGYRSRRQRAEMLRSALMDDHFGFWEWME